MAVTKKTKLTYKQAKFVKGIAEGDPPTQSALKSYNVANYETAAVIASENLKKPNVREAIDQAMIKLNLTAERALAPLDDALDHEDINVRLKATTVWRSLLPKELSETTGNTFNFYNNKQ